MKPTHTTESYRTYLSRHTNTFGVSDQLDTDVHSGLLTEVYDLSARSPVPADEHLVGSCRDEVLGAECYSSNSVQVSSELK